MEMWYYIKKGSIATRVTFEEYQAYKGDKFYTPSQPCLRFFCEYFRSLR